MCMDMVVGVMMILMKTALDRHYHVNYNQVTHISHYVAFSIMCFRVNVGVEFVEHLVN